MTSEDIDNISNFVASNKPDNIIKVIGVGGGGNNAIAHMYEQGINNVSFVIINTDWQALKNSPVPNKVLIGRDGLGAGNVPEVAREAAEESAEKIGRLFDDETKMVFITAGMGGGTGTGAAPVVARIAHDKGILTIGIVTIPFLFEGQKKILKALDGAEEMSKYVDAILVVNNEQLTEIYADLNLMNAFGKADDTLSNAARSISELITCDGYMNLDFKDVNTTLKNSGAAIISTGYGEGEHRVTKAINDALHSPLLKNRDIFGSKRLLFNLYYSRNAEQEFIMGEASELTSFINNLDPDVDVIYGIGFDDTLGNKIKMTILAAGFELVIKGGNDRQLGTISGASPDLTRGRDNNVSAPAPAADPDKVLKETYGTKGEDIIIEREAMKYIVLSPEQLEDDNVIEVMEGTPAFNRDRATVNKLRNNQLTDVMHAPQAPAPEAATSSAPSRGSSSDAAASGSGQASAAETPRGRVIDF